MGRPPTGWTTLGRSLFMRVPLPAARMIAMGGCAAGLGDAWLIVGAAGDRGGEKLADLDSNQDKQNQNLLCYRYTIGQKLSDPRRPCVAFIILVGALYRPVRRGVLQRAGPRWFAVLTRARRGPGASRGDRPHKGSAGPRVSPRREGETP